LRRILAKFGEIGGLPADIGQKLAPKTYEPPSKGRFK